MCRPDHYGIEYEINPWMSRDRASDRPRAIAQWERLTAILRELGAAIELIDPQPGLPDIVFTANAGLVHGKRFVPSHFRHPERQEETAHFAAWMREHGFEIVDIYAQCDDPAAAFEGAGDALYCGAPLIAGYLHRSDISLHKHLAKWTGERIISVELVDPAFYHLDTCFCPLAPGLAMYHPKAFDSYGRRAIEEAVPNLIAAAPEDADRFGCNAVVLGTDVVLNAGCDRLEAQLRELGFTPHSTDLSEFLKSGGSAKCLTLRLDGEDAAIW